MLKNILIAVIVLLSLSAGAVRDKKKRIMVFAALGIVIALFLGIDG